MQQSLKGLGAIMADKIDLIYQNVADDEEIPTVAIKQKVLQDTNKVRLVCGGGSGHEPSHGGYVCDQMLSGAVCGRVFASPSLQQVRHCLEWLIQGKTGQEILVIIKNYTGDLINFRSAVAMVSSKHDVNIKVLEVGDDAALLGSLGKMAPRGVAGTSLLYKILGGAAYEGKDLSYVHGLGETLL